MQVVLVAKVEVLEQVILELVVARAVAMTVVLEVRAAVAQQAGMEAQVLSE